MTKYLKISRETATALEKMFQGLKIQLPKDPKLENYTIFASHTLEESEAHFNS